MFMRKVYGIAILLLLTGCHKNIRTDVVGSYVSKDCNFYENFFMTTGLMEEYH